MKKVIITKLGGVVMKVTIELNREEFAAALETGALNALSTVMIRDEKPQVIKDAPAQEEPKQVETVETKSEETKPAKTISEVEIRAKFVELNKKGKKEELKKLLTEMNVEKVSDLKPDQYEEVMQKLEAI